MTTVTARVSIEEYLSYEAPPGFRDELIEGEIILAPDPKPLHATICENLYQSMQEVLKNTEYSVHLATNMVLAKDDSMPSPDVFVIDKDRWTAAIREDKYPDGSPQLAVEVYSPSNRPGLIRKKIELYLKNGSAAVWVIYPKRRAVVVHDQSDLTAEYRDGEKLPLPAELSNSTIEVSKIFEL